jgi:hypothetical protein
MLDGIQRHQILRLSLLGDRGFTLQVSVQHVRSNEQKAVLQESLVSAVTEIVRRHLGAQQSHAWIGTASRDHGYIT